MVAFPQLGKLQKKYAEQGFEILGVAQDEPETLKEYLAKKPLSWPNILDSEGVVGDKMKLDSYPTYFLIDKKGKHVATPYDATEIEKALLPLLAE